VALGFLKRELSLGETKMHFDKQLHCLSLLGVMSG